MAEAFITRHGGSEELKSIHKVGTYDGYKNNAYETSFTGTVTFVFSEYTTKEKIKAIVANHSTYSNGREYTDASICCTNKGEKIWAVGESADRLNVTVGETKVIVTSGTLNSSSDTADVCIIY